MNQETSKYAKISLAFTALTGVLTSVHYFYEMGFKAVILVLLLLVLPVLMMRWLKKTGSKMALRIYGLITTWLVIGFGFFDGFWNHVVKKFGYYYVLLPAHGGDKKVVEKTFSILPTEVGNFLFEATGILTFIMSIIAAYYLVKFIRVRKQFITNIQNNIRGQYV